jgi:hypothetical protein
MSDVIRIPLKVKTAPKIEVKVNTKVSVPLEL